MADPTPTPAPSSFVRLLKDVGFVLLGIVLAAGIGMGGLWLWLHPAIAPPDPIVLSIDPQTPPHVGRRILIHAQTKGTLVKWQVLSAPPGAYDLWAQDEPNHHDQNLTTPVAGDYRLLAATVVAGEADLAEIHVLVDVGPAPIPPGPTPPGPTPGPIPSGALRLLLTFDPAAQYDQGPWEVLKAAATQKLVPSGNWKVYQTNQTFGDELSVWKDVFQKRKNPVGIVIFNGQDGSVAYEGPLPNGMAEATALVKKYGG